MTNFTSTNVSAEKTVYVGLSLGVPETQLMYCYFDNLELTALPQPAGSLFTVW